MITNERREEFRRDVTKTFRFYARFYDVIEWFMPMLKNNPRLMLAVAIPADAEVVLDACTGNGAVLAAIASSHPNTAVYGLDLSPDMLGLAQRRIARKRLANVQVYTGDCTKMPFSEGIFDFVTGSYGLHEMPADVRRAAVCEAFRVLKDGGRLLVIDWDEPHNWLQKLGAPLRRAIEPDWIPEIFGDGLCRLFEEAGFEDVSVRRDIFMSQMVTGTKPFGVGCGLAD